MFVGNKKIQLIEGRLFKLERELEAAENYIRAKMFYESKLSGGI